MSASNSAEASSALLESLRQRIQRDGPIAIDQYMTTCVADPQHGYWSKAGAIGAAGDFITAPEISQVFGELIGLWCAVAWHSLGQPSPVRLVELGPGRGTLMQDALRAARAVPGFVDAASLHLVEISAPLRVLQKSALAGHVVTWHDVLDSVPTGPAIIIANEFLDALPIRQLILSSDGVWRERMVGLGADGQLCFVAGSPVHHDAGIVAHPGAIVELRPGEDRLLAALSARQPPVIALFVDYGPADPALGDTLQAVRRHAYVDPLAEPGSADLTAHVQLAGFAQKAREAGLAAAGPMTQAEFLGRLGVAERAARLMAANPDRAGEIEAGVQRLMAPTGMGQLFKVMAVHSPGLPPLPPFS
ncbi:MAG: SAM-dependent methyltransferase [Hyphomicrobiaceae bacterium]|nr:MAG: SAM-dependent methyltransferase [Hyphomicrobiaceae bacterium]